MTTTTTVPPFFPPTVVYTFESPLYLTTQKETTMAKELLLQLGRPLDTIDDEIAELEAVAVKDSKALW